MRQTLDSRLHLVAGCLQMGLFMPCRNTKGRLNLRFWEEILVDPTTSNWLKDALESALVRDPVDALNDGLLLADLLQGRLRTVLEDIQKRTSQSN
jgi:hypothetical protein